MVVARWENVYFLIEWLIVQIPVVATINDLHIEEDSQLLESVPNFQPTLGQCGRLWSQPSPLRRSVPISGTNYVLMIKVFQMVTDFTLSY